MKGDKVCLENQNLHPKVNYLRACFVVVCQKNMFFLTMTSGDVFLVLCTYLMIHCGRTQGKIIEMRHSPYLPHLPLVGKLSEMRHLPHLHHLPL